MWIKGLEWMFGMRAVAPSGFPPPPAAPDCEVS
jgi:hypothetical protein